MLIVKRDLILSLIILVLARNYTIHPNILSEQKSVHVSQTMVKDCDHLRLYGKRILSLFMPLYHRTPINDCQQKQPQDLNGQEKKENRNVTTSTSHNEKGSDDDTLDGGDIGKVILGEGTAPHMSVDGDGVDDTRRHIPINDQTPSDSNYITVDEDMPSDEETTSSDRSSSSENDERVKLADFLASQERRKRRRRSIIAPTRNAEDYSFEQLQISSSSASDDSKQKKDKGVSQTDEGKRASSPFA